MEEEMGSMNAERLEDGEIVSDQDENSANEWENFDYALNERPKVSSVPHNAENPDALGKDSSTSSSESDDSDDEVGSSKRVRYQTESIGMKSTPALPPSPQKDLKQFNDKAKTFNQSMKNLDIWTQVLEEQDMESKFNAISVKGPTASTNIVEFERGPESFHMEKKKRIRFLPAVYESSDVSSEGLSDDTLEYLNGSNKRRLNAKKRKKIKRTQRKYKAVVKKKSPEDMAKHIAEKLQEPKVELINKCIQAIGKEDMARLFFKTLKIEKRGGLLVMNQERRRTPGGVFFYLLRRDRRFSRSKVDHIFKDDTQNNTFLRKKKIAIKRLKRKAKLEQLAKATMPVDIKENKSESSEQDEEDEMLSSYESSDNNEDEPITTDATESNQEFLEVHCKTENLLPV